MWSLRGRLGLLADHDFRNLFASTTVTHFGGQLASLAISLVAVVALGASEFEIGLLFTLATAASLLVGLPAGVWVDRVPRRLVLVVSDLGRAALFLSIPLAWWAGALTIWQLYCVALLRGVAGVFFDVAYQSYLPDLVGRRNLMEANTKLEGVRAVSQVAGPGLAGQLIQAVTAPVALVGNAVAVALSVWFVLRIRKPEHPPGRTNRRGLVREIGEGLRLVLENRLLRTIAACSSIFNLFWSAYMAMFVVFLVRELQLREGAIGIILMYAGAGGLAGLMLGRRVVARVGQGPALWMAPAFIGPCALLIPLAQPGFTVWLAACGHLLAFAGIVVYNVTQVSFRQGLTPGRLLGRMNATMRFFVWGTMPIGAFAGGVLGEWLGTRATLWIAATGAGLAFLPVFLSPLRGMRQLPVRSDEDELAGATP